MQQQRVSLKFGRIQKLERWIFLCLTNEAKTVPDWQVQENLCLLNLHLGLGWFFGLDASPAAGLNVTASQRKSRQTEEEGQGENSPAGKTPLWPCGPQVSQGHIQAAVLL